MNWAKPLTKKHQTRRANKYDAQRFDIAGESFDSKLEAEVYATLKLMERGGLIKNIRRQVTIQLTSRVKWRADFLVFEVKRAQDVIIEAKGFVDQRFRVILQLLPEFSPMIVQIWMKKGSRVFMFKEIIPGEK
jgi:hypothetical protein